jgi:hypothetical protein
MRSWTFWALSGVALCMILAAAVLVIGAARLFPRVALRLARSGLAVGALHLAWTAAVSRWRPQH